MPKRMLDSSYLNSPSLDRCSPGAQDAFPRFILLADDFGCFEVDARRLLALGWSSSRRDVTEEGVVRWLNEYVGSGMACLWKSNERRYCYLTGWNGPHGQRKRVEYDPAAAHGTAAAKGSKRRTPPPPDDLVAAVLAGVRRDCDGMPPGTDREIREPGQIPPGNTPGTISNDSVPAREIREPAASPVASREVPPISAAVVAVPVVVASVVASASATRGEDDPDTRPSLPVEDGGSEHAPMWVQAQEYRRQIANARALTRIPAGSLSPEDWNWLDAKVQRVGGPGVAATWTLERLEGRSFRNLAYCVKVLRDMPDRPAEMVIPEATDERWAKVLDQARESMYPEHWNLLARCAGAVDGGTLRLTARDADHAETVRTRYAMLLENKTGYAVEVRP